MEYRNETLLEELSKCLVTYGRNDVTLMMATICATVNMAVKWWLSSRKWNEFPQKAVLNSGHKFCEMELEHTNLFLMLNHHFTAMPTVALQVAIRISTLLPHVTKNSWSFSSSG